jgi:hypothetical protein
MPPLRALLSGNIKALRLQCGSPVGVELKDEIRKHNENKELYESTKARSEHF